MGVPPAASSRHLRAPKGHPEIRNCGFMSVSHRPREGLYPGDRDVPAVCRVEPLRGDAGLAAPGRASGARNRLRTPPLPPSGQRRPDPFLLEGSQGPEWWQLAKEAGWEDPGGQDAPYPRGAPWGSAEAPAGVREASRPWASHHAATSAHWQESPRSSRICKEGTGTPLLVGLL